VLQDGDYESPISRYMSDGKFLLQGHDVEDYFSAGFDLITKKLVDISLTEHGYQWLPDDNYEDQESCEEQSVAFWRDIDDGACMRLTYRGDGDSNHYYVVDDDLVSKIEDYGIDLGEYVDYSCDCALNGDGEPDYENLPQDGSIPQCFYNIPCKNAEICGEYSTSF
jgi:hypothetical protein